MRRARPSADLIVTVGGGSITDGAKAVQLCLANGIDDVEGIERIRVRKGVAPEMTAADRAADQRADHDRRRRVQRDRWRHRRAARM